MGGRWTKSWWSCRLATTPRSCARSSRPTTSPSCTWARTTRCGSRTQMTSQVTESLVDSRVISELLTREAPWHESHGADGAYLGMGLLYYALTYSLRADVAVCLGSGGGFVPRLMRQAQRDLGI